MSPAGKNIDKTVSPLKQKPVQFKYKMSKDIPKTSLSPKKIGNSTKVIVCGTGHNLVLARTEHPSKNGEDGYTYDAKKMLIEDVEKAANLGVINIVNRRENKSTNAIVVQASGYNSQQFVFKLDESQENNKINRENLIRPFVNFLNNDVAWKYPQTFVLVQDETTGDGKKIGKIDNYVMNSDIAGYFGKYVFDNDPSEVASSVEMMDEIFEAPENKIAASVFFPQFWNSWNNL